MCVRMKSSALRETIQSRCTRISIDSAISGLKISGSMVEIGSGNVELEDDYDDQLKAMCEPVETGDIVYVMNLGLFLVTDRHPKSAKGSDLMRVIRVTPNTDGQFQLMGRERTALVSPKSAVRIRKSKFDPVEIERLTYQRFLAFQKVDECNAALLSIREQE